MLCIWLDYGRERKAQKPGASARKGFRYPAIIPIVYYEGKAAWTAERRFLARIPGGEAFRQWIPDFTYEVVRLHDYSNEELLSRGDEMSLIMLFNKIQDVIDLSEFLKLPRERLDEIVKETPETVIDFIVSAMESLCGKIDAAEEETRKCVDKVKERRMGYLWENMEKMSIQEERRNTAQARAEAKKAKADALEDKIRLIIKYCKRFQLSKEQAVSEIMSECGMDRETAQQKADTYWGPIMHNYSPSDPLLTLLR